MSNTAILHWVNNELTANRNDTVHDFLAHLAEQLRDWLLPMLMNGQVKVN